MRGPSRRVAPGRMGFAMRRAVLHLLGISWVLSSCMDAAGGSYVWAAIDLVFAAGIAWLLSIRAAAK